MKKILIIIFLFVFNQIVALADEISIDFYFKLGIIKGGEATLTIKDTTFNGRSAINYHVVGKTTGLANALYGVYDVYETTVDAKTFLPLKTIRNVKEGSYKRYTETLFYHDVDSINSSRSGWREIPNNCVDILSVFFYFINKNNIKNMHSGDAVIYPVYSADKIYNINIKYLRDEKINTSAGEVDTHVLGPVIKSKFISNTSGIKCYMTKESKLIVYAELDLTFGALKAVLKSYKVNGVEQKIALAS